MLYTIIKVGKSSDIKLKNTRAYRAVNFMEVESYLSKKDNISLVIFEDITEHDIDCIMNIANTYVNSYIAYNKNERLNEGLIDRLLQVNIPYIVGLRDLQNYIETNIGIIVSTYPKEKTSEVDTNNIVTVDIGEEDSIPKDEPESNADKLTDFELFDSKLDKSGDSEDEEENNAIADELEESLKAMQENIDVLSNKDDEYIDEDVSIIIKSKDFLDSDDDINKLLDGDEVTEETDKTDLISSEEVNKVLQEKDVEINELNSQLEFALGKLKDLSYLRDNLQQERDSLLDKINNIVIDDDVTEVIIGALDRDGYEKRINELQTTISELNLKVMDIDQLNSRVDNLREQIQEQNDTESSLRAEIDRLKDNTEIEQLTKGYENRVRSEVKSRLSLAEVVCALSIKLNSVNTVLISKTKQFNESVEVLEQMRKSSIENEAELNKLKNRYENEIRQLKSSNSLSEGKITELNEAIQQLRGEISKLEFEVEKKQRQFDESDSEVIRLKDKLQTTSNQLRIATEKVRQQEVKLNEYSAKNYEEIQMNSEALEHSQKELMGMVGNYRKKVTELEATINSRALEIDTLKKQNDDLRTQAKSIQLTNRLGNLTRFNCNYTGKAIVIQVFGSGSVGVTTTAMSLCNKLRGKVLYMDMDIVSPKAEGWFVKSPIIKSLVDIPQNAVMYRTAFGAFLYKNIDFIIDHESEIIQNIMLTKDGFKLDYFSGLYTKADVSMFMSADFSQLFTYFGNSYDFIICDMGRVGGSDTQSALIRTVDEISLKNVCVCMHDSVDVRSASIRLGNEQITREKTIWLLNMATSTKLDSIIQKSIAKSPYVLMPKNMSIFGTKTSFDKVNLLKDKLSELCEKIINNS